MRIQKCGICHEKMDLLPDPTEHQSLPVFVCRNIKKNYAGFPVYRDEKTGTPISCDGYPLVLNNLQEN